MKFLTTKRIILLITCLFLFVGQAQAVITTLDTRNEYTATSGQTVFTYTFKIYTDSDLNVYITPSGQAPDDTTDIVGAYTVSGVGDENGGSITLSNPVDLGNLVTIVSAIPSNRTTDYQFNGDFLPGVVNDDFDRSVSLIKQAEDVTNRSLVLPESQQGTKPLSLPEPVAGRFLKWNGGLTGLENADEGTATPIDLPVDQLSEHDDLADAVSDIGGTDTELWLDASDSSNATVPSNISIRPMIGNIMSGTVAWNGPIIGDPVFQWISGTGHTFGNDSLKVLRPEILGAASDGSCTGNVCDGTGTENATALQRTLDIWETIGGTLALDGTGIYRIDTAIAMLLDTPGTEASAFILEGNGARIDCSNHQAAGEACLTLGGVASSDFNDEGMFVVNNLHLVGPEDGNVIDGSSTQYTTEGLYIKYAGNVTLNSVIARNYYRGFHTQFTFPLTANYVCSYRNGIGILLDEASNVHHWKSADVDRCEYAVLISGDVSEGDDDGKISSVTFSNFHSELCLNVVVIDPGPDDSNVTIRGIKFDGGFYVSQVSHDLFRVGLDFVYADPEIRQSNNNRLMYDFTFDLTGLVNPTNALFRSASGADNGQAIFVFGGANPRLRRFTGLMPAGFQNVYSGLHDGGDGQATMSDSDRDGVTLPEFIIEGTASGEDAISDKLIGSTVNNRTDGSSCPITDNTESTIICVLTGGTDDDWDNDDEYEVIIPGVVGNVKGGELTSSDAPGGIGPAATFLEERKWDEDGVIYYGNNVETAFGIYTISAYGRTMLESTNAAVAATLGDGARVGQIKEVGFIGGNASTLTVTNHADGDGIIYTFNATDDYLALKWAGTEWGEHFNIDVTHVP